MKNFINKILKKKKVILITIAFIGVSLFFISIHSVLAETNSLGVVDSISKGVGTAVATVLSWVAWVFLMVFGLLLTLLVKILVNVASFNNIINVAAVTNGWVIVRDLCNMFFILILLVVAFATILRIESYQWKKILPKLLIMAVLINFSRTICGLIIDFAQVIMLTFVNGFSQYGAANFINMFQTNKIAALWKGADVSSWSVVVGIITGVLALVITNIVVIVMLAVLVMRVIMLWVYTILSPIAFLAAAFPAGQKYSSQWWGEFSKNVIVGPVLAFFIWLALTAAQQSSSDVGTLVAGSNDICAGAGTLFCESSFQTFIITIGLLVGGLMVTQQMGGIAASIAGKGMAWAKGAAGVPLAVGKFAGKYGALKVGRGLDTLQMKAQQGVAGLFGVSEANYKPKSLNYRMIAAGWQAKRAKDMEKYETQHGGLANIHQDNFNKYIRFGQYGAWRKNKSTQARDEEAAGKLDYESKMLFERQGNSALTEPERKEKQEAMKKAEADRINSYKSKGFSEEEAKKEFDKDIAALTDEDTYEEIAGESFSDIDGHVTKNQQQAKELRDKRAKIFGVRAGFKGATQYEPQYSKAGSKEILEKKTKEMEQRTEGKDFALVSELIKAYEEKDQQNIAAAFRILAKNNDINEALKDSRVMNLMTQDGGVLEKLAASMDDGDEKNNLLANMGNVKKNMRANPVSPANVQAIIQGMFAASGMEKGMAARYTSDIGTISFGAGNSVVFGAARGNANTGNFMFNKLEVDKETGALVSGADRIAAINGKMANMGSQEKIRTIHPDVIIKEAPDGSGAGIHAEGAAFLKTLTSHDLSQISRLRVDVVRKIGGSKAVLSDAKKIVAQLEAAGDETSKQQAAMIKNFIGYCKKSYEGADMKDQNSLKGAEDSFNKI